MRIDGFTCCRGLRFNDWDTEAKSSSDPDRVQDFSGVYFGKCSIDPVTKPECYYIHNETGITELHLAVRLVMSVILLVQ